MRYRMSVIYGHPVITATRALRFADHVTKRNGGSGDENGSDTARLPSEMFTAECKEDVFQNVIRIAEFTGNRAVRDKKAFVMQIAILKFKVWF